VCLVGPSFDPNLHHGRPVDFAAPWQTVLLRLQLYRSLGGCATPRNVR
jgi:hypothetical protein